MTLKNTFKTALTGLKANKMRSALTVLGIVIGVVAIITVMSVSQGAENLILGQIEGMGANLIIIKPGREPKGPSDMAEMMSDSLKERDIKALKNKKNVPDLLDAVPAVAVPGTVSWKGETFKASVMGWSAEWLSEMFDVYPEEGILFSEQDIKMAESVAVIGSRVKKELFGLSDAVGRKIKIKNRNFKVVGVLPPKGQVAMFNLDEIVVIPHSTAQKYLLGIDYYHEILAKAKNEQVIPAVVADIERTLRELHGIEDPAKDDFYVMTQTGIVEQVGTITGILSLLLASLAAISLIVGGVGVMNIMLVSVTERTREIGIRKAVGARNRDILNQFLLEAVVLTAIGGIIGVILGAILSFVGSIMNHIKSYL